MHGRRILAQHFFCALQKLPRPLGIAHARIVGRGPQPKQIDQCLGILRVEEQCAFELLGGFALGSGAHEQESQIVASLDITRTQFDRLQVSAPRIFQPTEFTREQTRAIKVLG